LTPTTNIFIVFTITGWGGKYLPIVDNLM